MYIINKSALAVAHTVAWAIDEEKENFFAKLVRSYIEVDGGAVFRVVEWVVYKKGQSDFAVTVPLGFGFHHRNCHILCDEEIPLGVPFEANQVEVVKVNGKFMPIDENPPVMVVLTPITNERGQTDNVINLV